MRCWNRACAWSWLATLLVALVTASSRADEGWSLSKLNPFATKPKSSKTSPTRNVSDAKSSGNSLNPFAKKPATSAPIKSTTSRRKSEPSVLTKTWETITPWDDHPAKKPAPLVTKKSSKANEKSWWDSFFGPAEEVKQPKTVNEFLDQEKPGF